MNKLFILALLAVLVIPTASAMENTTYYFDPPNPIASGCGDTVVRVMAHAPYGLNVVEFAINSSPCIDIVDCEFNPAWTMTGWNGTTGTIPKCWGPGHDWFSTWAIFDLEGPEAWICNITIRCKDPSCTYCKTNMNFTCGLDPGLCMFIVAHSTHGIIPHNATNGIFTCGEAPAAEMFSKDLYEGWNLISLPLVPEGDNSASAVLSGVSYDAVYRYNATSKQFESIEGTDAMNPITGYFVHATADCTWNYSGTAYNSMDLSLEQGLNMVGWLNCSKDAVDALSSLSGEYHYVARWDATAEKFEVYNPKAPAFNDFTTIDRGTGYFISAKQGRTLSESC